jgi:6-pyruvoyltetrahydropterin/6-carboxytetrahydropterin synthase
MTRQAQHGYTYGSRKSYGHEIGLSCCFRQWKAQSHCNLLHGYALAVKFTFEGVELDERNWIADFGGFKPLKAHLENTFDHTLLVAEDDPMKAEILRLQELGLPRVVEVRATGCEETARLIFEVTEQWLKDAGYGNRVEVTQVEVCEHGANSAYYRKKD